MASYDSEQQRRLLLEAGRRKFEELRKKHRAVVTELSNNPESPAINLVSTNVRNQFAVEQVEFVDGSFVDRDHSFLETPTKFQNSSNIQTPLRASHLLPPNLTPIHFVPLTTPREKLSILTKPLPLDASQPPTIPTSEVIQLKEDNIELKNQLADVKLHLVDARDKVNELSKYREKSLGLEQECISLRAQLDEYKEKSSRMVPSEQLFSIQEELHRIIGEAASLNVSLNEASAKNYLANQEIEHLRIQYDSLLLSTSTVKKVPTQDEETNTIPWEPKLEIETDETLQIATIIAQLKQENQLLQSQLYTEQNKSTKLLEKIEIIRQKELEDKEQLADIVATEVKKVTAALEEEIFNLKREKEENSAKHRAELLSLQQNFESNSAQLVTIENKVGTTTTAVSTQTNQTENEAFNLLLLKVAKLEQTVESQWNTIENLSIQKNQLLSQIRAEYKKSSVLTV